MAWPLCRGHSPGNLSHKDSRQLGFSPLKFLEKAHLVLTTWKVIPDPLVGKGANWVVNSYRGKGRIHILMFYLTFRKMSVDGKERIHNNV